MGNGKISMKKAVFINAISKYMNVIIGVIVNAILARIIAPEDYGLVAIITVFSTFFATMSDMGLGTAVIQDKTLNSKDIDSIFSFSIYVSILLMGIFYGVSYIIGFFYGKDILVNLGHWLSISLLFNSMNMVPNGVLNREKRFFEMAVRNIVVYVTSALIAIMAAFAGFGIYALIIQSLLSSVFMFIWSEALTKLHASMKFEIKSIKKIAKYSGYQYAFSLINYFSRNLDNLLAGKFLGTVEVAYYNRAYNLMLYPVNNITGVITPVLHPILSDYQNDKGYIYKQYVKIVKLIALISIYVEVYCIFAAPDIIRLIYGEQWDASIICFKILSLAIITQMVTGTSGSVYQALGQTQLLFIAGLINVFITVTATVLGIVVGSSIEFLAWCVSLSYICHFFVSYYIMMKYAFQCSYGKFLKEFAMEMVILIMLLVFGLICPISLKSSLANVVLKAVYFGGVYLIGIYVTKEYKYFEMLIKRKR